MQNSPWLRLSTRIDRWTDRLGGAVSWLTVLLVFIGAYNAIVRYVGRFFGWSLSSNFYIELQQYLFGLVFLLAAGYALRHDAHVRVDVLYGRFSRRIRAWINVFGTVLLLVPFCVFVLLMSWPSVRNSWAVLEQSPDPGGLPRYPLKAVILLCFVLVLLQAVSEFIKELHLARGGDPLEPDETLPEGAL